MLAPIPPPISPKLLLLYTAMQRCVKCERTKWKRWLQLIKLANGSTQGLPLTTYHISLTLQCSVTFLLTKVNSLIDSIMFHTGFLLISTNLDIII